MKTIAFLKFGVGLTSVETELHADVFQDGMGTILLQQQAEKCFQACPLF